jgi:hypothetical protein
MKVVFALSFTLALMAPISAVPTASVCDDVATQDDYMFTMPIANFITARNNNNPSCFNWTSDACTDSPDAPLGNNFKPNCQRHDFGWRNLEKFHRTPLADLEQKANVVFHNGMLDVCAARPTEKQSDCKVAALCYYCAVNDWKDTICPTGSATKGIIECGIFYGLNLLS